MVLFYIPKQCEKEEINDRSVYDTLDQLQSNILGRESLKRPTLYACLGDVADEQRPSPLSQRPLGDLGG